jgi:hypothetical protein
MKTVGRLVALYPAGEQNSARTRLADNLHAVISQRLVPASTGGKIVAQEIMINNLGIQECILNEAKTCEIPSFIEKGREVSGMQTFDQHLSDLVHRDLVEMEVAIQYASNPSDFQRNFDFQGASSTIGSDNDLSMVPSTTGEDDSQQGISLEPSPNGAWPGGSAPIAKNKSGLAPLPTPIKKAAPTSFNIDENSEINDLEMVSDTSSDNPSASPMPASRPIAGEQTGTKIPIPGVKKAV